MKQIPPPPIHWGGTRTGPATKSAVQLRAGVAPPPTQYGPSAVQRQAMQARQGLLQPCSLLSWFCCGKRSSSEEQAEDEVELIEDRGSLPPWGSATFLGYHWTGAWDKIKTSGFKAGGGQLGTGVYLCVQDHSWVPMVYRNLNTLLEVGYVGDMSTWKRVEIDLISSFKNRSDCDDYDVIKTKSDRGVQNQICYRTDGPSNINIANFRVRLAQVEV